MGEAKRKKSPGVQVQQELSAAQTETAIQIYVQACLAPRLRKLGLDAGELSQICADVQTRLSSLLSHWNDEPFRRAILTLGLEEAQFWEPAEAALEVRALVVLGVRNSLVENLNAAAGTQRQVLTDTALPALTREAISFFQKVDLARVVTLPTMDVFGALAHRFPNAWQCLRTLAEAATPEVHYHLPVEAAEPLNFTAEAAGRPEHLWVIGNGMDIAIDPGLGTLLDQMAQGALQVLHVPSFSRLTRNPEKLFGVLDHMLRHGATLVTLNYMLSASYVARRDPLIRPPHDEQAFTRSRANPEGLSLRHRKFWKLGSPADGA